MSAMVTIIMPVFNSATTLLDSVRSVQQQTFEDWELLLVDDSSTDNSLELCKELALQDPRIHLISLPSNVGAAAARNAGISQSHSSFLAFLDSDDIWLPRKLQVQMEAMEREGLAISYTDYEWVDRHGQPMGVVRSAPDHLDHEALLAQNFIGLSTSMLDIRRTGRPEMPLLRLNHDYAMWLELLRRDLPNRRIPQVLMRYRRHPASLSRNKLESTWTNFHILHAREGIPVARTTWLLLRWGLKSLALHLAHPAHKLA